jgi:hypothetical protein
LGDDFANELVDWFNAVDLTYRAELREINELNYARFEAKLSSVLLSCGRSCVSKSRELRVEFHTEMQAMRISLLRWMLGSGSPTLLTLLGAMATWPHAGR